MARNSCGPQTELVSNSAVRVASCPCGTVHVTLMSSGVTVRLTADAFRAIAAGIGVAAERFQDRVEITSTGSTSIN